MNNNRYDTLSQAIVELKRRGFKENFTVDNNSMLCSTDDNMTPCSAEDSILHEFHRFEGMTDPGDSSVVYAIETSIGVKGLLVDAYGADSAPNVRDYIKKVDESMEGSHY
ncbi:MAG: phosphoribosylpyrophosphate synthetase [Chitinophagales bacterium]|nr:phosphoribosylpyrophosphate synthetase [Chitinophagales bacterium]